MDLSRRHFLTLSASAAAGGALAGQGDAHGAAPVGAAGPPLLVAQAGTPAPLGFNPADPAPQVRAGDRQRRRGGSGAEDARQARHRHPLRPDRGGGGEHPARPGRPAHRRGRQAGDAGADRPAHASLPAPGHRAARRRAGADHRDHHRGVGGRRGRVHLRQFPPRGRAPVAHAPLRLRAHLLHRAGGRARPRRDAQHRLRQRGGLRQGRGRERRPHAGRQGAHHRFGGGQQRPRAAAARHPRGRDGGQAVPRDVPHRLGARQSLRPARPAAARRRAHPRLQRGREQHGAERTA